MTVFTIKPAEWSELPHRQYKKGMGSRALVASDGRGVICIDRIGAGLDFEISEGGIPEQDVFKDAPLGISLWEGQYQYDCGCEGEFRSLTDDEWKRWYETGTLWDDDDWYEPQPV